MVLRIKFCAADVTDYKACFIDRLSDGTLVYEVQRFNNHPTLPNTRGMLIAVANSGSDIKAKWLAGGAKENLMAEGVERLFSYDANATYDNISGSANEGVSTNKADFIKLKSETMELVNGK